MYPHERTDLNPSSLPLNESPPSSDVLESWTPETKLLVAPSFSEGMLSLRSKRVVR